MRNLGRVWEKRGQSGTIATLQAKTRRDPLGTKRENFKISVKNQVGRDAAIAQAQGTTAPEGTSDNPSHRIFTVANVITMCRFVLTGVFLYMFVNDPQSLPGAHVLRDSGRDGLFGRPGGAPHADGQLARKDHGPRDGPRAAVYRRARPHAQGGAPGVDGRVRDRPRCVPVCGIDDPAEVPAPPGGRDLRGQVRDRVPHDGLQLSAAGAAAR
jgi:hypothetical protein